MGSRATIAARRSPRISISSRVGLVTTAGYGHAIGRSIALAYLRSDLAKPETRLEVEILGERRAAIVAREPIYDPENARLRM